MPDLDLQIFEVKVSGSLDKRIAIATDAFKLMKTTASYRTLVAFHSDETQQWRFSLITAQPTLKDGKVVTKLSSPKRYSYLLGPGSKLATPNKQLVSKGKVIDFDDLSKRFAAEVVNNEFYREIAKLYDELIGTDQIEGALRHPEAGETSHEFAVRLIGRIIFCWFLREKHSAVGTPLIPTQILSREAAEQDNYYHSTLAPLFFEVLNKYMRLREDKFQTSPYSTIPYLNGGLFNPDLDDHYRFDKAVGASTPGLVEVPDLWLRKLFDLLELYNFTVDENTSYDIDLSIDPEMLGRIFENLLARINPETGETVRKLTGSFYTPREIVEYMADKALGNYLGEHTDISSDKLLALISYDLSDDAEHPLNSNEKHQITNALSSIRVLDPACGSGAFPIGILQKIVFILQRVDPGSKLWLDKQLEGASPELRQHLEQEFINKNFDYLRKLGVIRESIYGVDIQPVATEISRLRCFLTLIVDQSVDDKEENRGIEPLPNLDFKFVTANTLIELGDVLGDGGGQTGLFEDQTGISELKEVRDLYFTSHNSEREALKTRFTQVQNKMLQKMLSQGSGGFADVTHKLSSWTPFSHESTSWFDAEWMFGVTDGFDIVIANPPYVDSEHMVNSDSDLRDKLKDLYATARGNWDLFVPFVEKGLEETKTGGVLTYIIPNKIIGAKYATTLRKYLDSQDVLEIRDYSRINVFHEADVYPVTIAVKKSRDDSITSNFLVMADYVTIKTKNSVPRPDLLGDPLWDKYFLEPKCFQLIYNLSKLPNFREVNIHVLGSATVSEAYEIKKHLIDSREENQSLRLINTGTIDKYRSLWGTQKTQYIKDGYLFPVISEGSLRSISDTRYEQARSPKLIIAGMSSEIEVFYDTKGNYLAGKSTSLIMDTDDNLKFYLALLNSKLISFYVSNMYNSLKMAGGYLNISKEILESIPLPKHDDNLRLKLATLVGPGNDLNQEDIGKIDEVIYRLYDITDEEIKIIESQSRPSSIRTVTKDDVADSYVSMVA